MRPPRRRRSEASGYSVIEVLFVAGVIATATGIAVPQFLFALDHFRTLGAARYVSTMLQRARMEALARTTNVAVRFAGDGQFIDYAVYLDGNGNGVLSQDIHSGLDQQVRPVERLADHFSGVDFGVMPHLPAIEPGSAPPGADPIRLGPSNMVSFTPFGTSSTGSLYLRGLRNAQYAIRVFGETGRTRILKFDSRRRQWRPL
jgi:hypothetical protein